MERYDVIITGAGPAGLFCAVNATAPDTSVLILEKNRHPGEKFLLSGSGQCNVTHNGDIREFVTRYGRNGPFLRPALMAFSNRRLAAFFADCGLPLETDENGKVFPATRKAFDLLGVLLRESKRRGVRISCGDPVVSVQRAGEQFAVRTVSGIYRSTFLVIATGGLSYPKTGSTGDGYRFAQGMGHTITETGPALAPVTIQNYPFPDLAGLSFQGTDLSVMRDGRKVAGRRGDVLLTHTGLSGPAILDASRMIHPGDMVTVSFAGGTSPEIFGKTFTRKAGENGHLPVRTLLAGLSIPERLAKRIAGIAGIDDTLTCAHLTAGKRRTLVRLCTAFPFEVEFTGGYSVAMATRGGVCLEEVDKKTMESMLVKNLYFCGEVLDIDGDTGGYNLQAAFSTGMLAAQSIRRKVSRDEKRS
jgi:predicted Rossmann fold flavoprotein